MLPAPLPVATASAAAAANRFARTAHTINCIWWNSISGSTISPACAPKSTLAIGRPAARLFLEPAKVIAIRSARGKPSRFEPYEVTVSITASSTASTPSRHSSRRVETWCQMPWTMPALKAV